MSAQLSNAPDVQKVSPQSTFKSHKRSKTTIDSTSKHIPFARSTQSRSAIDPAKFIVPQRVQIIEEHEEDKEIVDRVTQNISQAIQKHQLAEEQRITRLITSLEKTQSQMERKLRQLLETCRHQVVSCILNSFIYEF